MARILIVTAPYYKDITDEMTHGAVEVLEEHNHTYDRLNVSGAFEIPAAIARVANSQHPYDGYIALGCLIRGETINFDLISIDVTRALQELAVHKGLALGFGVLTVENFEQAVTRADRAQKNKGAEAAHAVVNILEIHRLFPLAIVSRSVENCVSSNLKYQPTANHVRYAMAAKKKKAVKKTAKKKTSKKKTSKKR